MLQILDEILDESKLEAGMITLETVDFDLAKTVEDAVTILGPRAEQKSLTLDMVLAPAVRGWFHGDPTRLRQIVLNLAGNAIKFTDEGRVGINIAVATETEAATTLRFEVSDTGVGIAPEARSRLFQKFAQADVSITRRFGGTGLGLAISRQLVEMMGGTIGFDSEPGKGTTFWFELSLPRAAAALSAPAVTEQKVIPPNQRRSFDLLVADDNKVNQQVARLMLTHAGHRVDVVDNGLEAVKAVQRKTYDVVLMDVQMPELDGVEATRRIRGLGGVWSRLPIIALTAHAMAGTDTEMLAAGMNDYLSKPFDAATLLSKVERIVVSGGSIGSQEAREDEDNNIASGFDATKLATLRQLTGPTDFEPMVTSFVQALQERVARAVELANEGKLPEAGREAHDVVSIAGNLGAVKLVEVARRLEVDARTDDPDLIRLLAAKLRSETDVLLPKVERFTANAA